MPLSMGLVLLGAAEGGALMFEVHNHCRNSDRLVSSAESLYRGSTQILQL